MMPRLYFSLLSLFVFTTLSAQQRPVGVWRAHLPTNSAQGIATDGRVNYVVTSKGFFTFETNTGQAEQYSKVEGLHDTNPVAVAYDAATETCIIAYANSNIDLFRFNSFKVLPDIKNRAFSGSKTIRHIFTDNGKAFLSTGQGIVVIDLDRQEIKETYVFSKGGQTMGIYAFTGDSTHYYAASDAGVYRIARNSAAPQVFANWQPVDTQAAYERLAFYGGSLFASTFGVTDTLFRIQAGAARQRIWYRDSTSILNLTGTPDFLYAGVFNFPKGTGNSYHFSGNPVAVKDSTRIGLPRGVVVLGNGQVWVADAYQGMGKRNPDGSVGFFNLGGPSDHESYDIYARGGEVWVAHGGASSEYLGANKRSGISRFANEAWKTFAPFSYPLFADSVRDFIELEMDARTGTLYAGTAETGIWERKADGTERIIRQGELRSVAGRYPATGLAVDQNGALWVNQANVAQELAARTAEGSWYHFGVPKWSRIFSNRGAKMLVDDYNQKWYLSPGGGVIVYSDNGTPENPGDDDSRNITQGKGSGNLPSPNVLSLVKDRDGAIWIGTDKGIAIFNSPSIALTDPQSDAELRVVQYDQFAGQLFSNEAVRAIAVDGGNRKWIGTTNGVWLLSADAGKIISRFTIDDSPLPSNIIQSITVDPLTGDVYIGTQDGLVSYRGTATEGAESAGDIKSFPSPVPSGYTGPITINGFTADADVRITDIAGQLIYRAKAAGGQLVWNGLDYTGHRPQSGVLLIFATDRDGTQKAVGKMMLLH